MGVSRDRAYDPFAGARRTFVKQMDVTDNPGGATDGPMLRQARQQGA